MSPGLLFLAAVYALLFWIVCVRWPKVALALVFALSPFQQDISGGGPLKFSISEVNLLLSLPVVLVRSRRLYFAPTMWPALACIVIGAACSSFQWRTATLTCLVQTGIYLVIAVFVFSSLPRSAEDFRLAGQGFILMAAFLAACVCITRAPYVLGLHKNGVGASIAAGLLIALEFSFQRDRRRVMYQGAIVLLSAGLVLTLSRGAWMSAMVGLLVIFLLRRQFGLMLRAGILMAVIIAVSWSLLPSESKEYATGFGGERWNIKLRNESRDFAWSQFMVNPLTGVGLGLRKEYDATNVVLLTLAESGVPGLLAFGLLHAVFARMIWKTQRRLPRAGMEFSAVAIASALILGKLAHGMVDHYWSRGTLMAAWGAVGMAAWVGYHQRLRKRSAAQGRRTWPVELPEIAASATHA